MKKLKSYFLKNEKFGFIHLFLLNLYIKEIRKGVLKMAKVYNSSKSNFNDIIRKVKDYIKRVNGGVTDVDVKNEYDSNCVFKMIYDGNIYQYDWYKLTKFEME